MLQSRGGDFPDAAMTFHAARSKTCTGRKLELNPIAECFNLRNGRRIEVLQRLRKSESESPLAEVLPSLHQPLRNLFGIQCEDQVITPVAIDV